jgi:hypothetical protein
MDLKRKRIDDKNDSDDNILASETFDLEGFIPSSEFDLSIFEMNASQPITGLIKPKNTIQFNKDTYTEFNISCVCISLNTITANLEAGTVPSDKLKECEKYVKVLLSIALSRKMNLHYKIRDEVHDMMRGVNIYMITHFNHMDIYSKLLWCCDVFLKKDIKEITSTNTLQF